MVLVLDLLQREEAKTEERDLVRGRLCTGPLIVHPLVTTRRVCWGGADQTPWKARTLRLTHAYSHMPTQAHMQTHRHMCNHMQTPSPTHLPVSATHMFTATHRPTWDTHSHMHSHSLTHTPLLDAGSPKLSSKNQHIALGQRGTRFQLQMGKLFHSPSHRKPTLLSAPPAQSHSLTIPKGRRDTPGPE